MPHFTVEHLREDQLAEARAFVQITGGDSLPEWWETEAVELIGRGGGVLVARAGDGSVHGLATYEVVKRPHMARVLAVARLVSFELSRKQPAKQALIHALDPISAAFECSAVAMPLLAKGDLRSSSSRVIGNGARI
ncbi:MAG: hypothetical protein ABI454_00885 [Sphingomicrobium sp.]